mmetsp:Transcript_2151/g.4810  ORF Transcript_2151/g.4810 Transcript_2151/m.4810 type:complete len:335 (-) Transcript_2151:189-1193(-)
MNYKFQLRPDKSAHSASRCLIEQVEVGGFFLFVVFFDDSRLGRTTASGGSGGSRCEGTRVSEVVLDLLRELKRVLGADGNSEHVLVRVDDGVRHGRKGRVVRREGDGRNLLDTFHELGFERGVGDVQNRRRVHGTLVVHFEHFQTVGERSVLHLTEQRRNGRRDTVTNLQRNDVVDDFNRTLVNLRRNVERLEERRLGRFHTSRTSRNDDFNRGNSTDTRRGRHNKLLNLSANIQQITLGEDDTDVADELVSQDHPRVVALFFAVLRDALAHQRVLTHEHDGFRANGRADVHELSGTDVIGVNQQGGVIVVEQLGHALGVALFLDESRGRHDCF